MTRTLFCLSLLFFLITLTSPVRFAYASEASNPVAAVASVVHQTIEALTPPLSAPSQLTVNLSSVEQSRGANVSAIGATFHDAANVAAFAVQSAGNALTHALAQTASAWSAWVSLANADLTSHSTALTEPASAAVIVAQAGANAPPTAAPVSALPTVYLSFIAGTSSETSISSTNTLSQNVKSSEIAAAENTSPVFATNASAEPHVANSTYVTQDQLAAALAQASNALRSLIYQNESVPGSLPSTGGTLNNIAVSNAIDQLNGTTLNNITVNGVSGLTVAEIPTDVVASNYLPLSGGTIAGNLNVTGSFSGGSLSLSAASTTGIIATNATTTNATTTSLFAQNASFAAATSTSLFATLANITGLTAINSTTTNATSTNFFATTASSTNLFASIANLANATISSLTLTNALTIANGGTGTTSATGATAGIQFLQSTSTAVARSVQSKLSDTISVKDFGATGNALTFKDGTITTGTNALSSASASFTAADVGKTIFIDYAGAAGAPLQTTITGFTDAHDVTLGANAVTSVPYSFLYAVFVATAQSGSGSYAPGDTIALSGGTAATPAVVTVKRTDVVSVSLVSGGTGGTTTTGATSGSCTVIGTTGSGERKFSLNVTLTSGVITSITSTASGGQYSGNPTSLSAEPVTGCGSLSGATVSLVMGVLMPIVTTQGTYSATASTLTQSSTSGSGTGATFTATFLTGGTFTYGTDDTQAWTNAINYEMQLDKAGTPACLYAPGGIYLITSSLPTFTTNGCITGAGQNKTYLAPAPSLSGDVLSWSDAWADGISTFGNSNYVISQQKTGPTIENIGVAGDLTAPNIQNAIAFRDREDNINLDNIEVDDMNGSCMTTGYTKNTSQSFIRESTIENFRCYDSGTAAHPAMDLYSSGSGPANNELEFDNIDIYAPNGPGIAFRNAGTGTYGQIRISNLRVEGQEGDPQLSAGDLIQIGSSSLSGIVNNITIDNLELVNPYLGYAALRMTADTSAHMPYYITVTGGHLTAPSGSAFGRGLEIDAGRNSSFTFSQIQSNDYNVYVGASPLVGSILISTNGNESSLYAYIDPTSVKSVTLPETFQTLASLISGGPNNTSSGLNALASVTTGSSNTAFGYNAGNALATGAQNVFVGAFAGQVHSLGNGDTYLGYNAGQADTVGFGNTCVGSNSCFQNTNGDNNIAIGGGAGYKLSPGSYANIIIGLDNATDGNQPKTDVDSIVIGDQLSAIPNNAYAQLDIGNLIFGTGLASTSVVSSGNIGIGTTSPAATLSVAGSGYLTAGLGIGLLNTAAGTLQTSGNATIGGSLTVNGATTTLANGLTINAGCIYINGGCLNTSGITNYWTLSGSNLYNNSGTNLGVGTTSPFAQFSIFVGGDYGSHAASTLFAIGSTTAGMATSTLFSVNSAGNVGIGTSSPMSALALNAGQIAVPNGTTAAPSFAFVSALNSGWYSGATNDVRLSVNGTDRFRSTGGIDYFNVATSIFGSDSGVTPLNMLSVYGDESVGTSYATIAAPSNGLIVQGNIGIGTSTPYARLSVWGPDAASSTLAFNVVSSASSTVFAVFDGGNAQLAGTLTQSSDQRLKTNIQSLDASSSLSLIDSLNPVTFTWINPSEGTTPQLGFIAQQVQQIFPTLISTTSATALTPNGTLGLNYIGLISPIVSAIQALDHELTSLATTVAGFAQSFTSAIGNFGQVNTNELCVGSTCVTPAQFQAMVAAYDAASDQSPSPAQQSPAAGSNPPESVTQNSASTTQATTPPTITISGANPAYINVGDSYADLGATVSDTGAGQADDPNLGLKTFLNGALVSNIVIDTGAVATDTIAYVATDSTGLTATSTRTVIIEATTAATSSRQ